MGCPGVREPPADNVLAKPKMQPNVERRLMKRINLPKRALPFAVLGLACFATRAGAKGHLGIGKAAVGDVWAERAGGTPPAAREYHTAVWTGSEMLVFGGYLWGPYGATNAGYFSDTWSYYPYAAPLRIGLSGPGQAVVAYPRWSSPLLLLCQGSDPGKNQWAVVTNAVSQVGSENQVILSPLAGNQFFLLEYP